MLQGAGAEVTGRGYGAGKGLQEDPSDGFIGRRKGGGVGCGVASDWLGHISVCKRNGRNGKNERQVSPVVMDTCTL